MLGKPRWSHFWVLVIAGSLPALFLALLRIAANASWTWHGLLLLWGTATMLLGLATLTRPTPAKGSCWRWMGLLWIGIIATAGFAVVRAQSATAGLVLVSVWWVALLHLHDVLSATRSRYRRWTWRALLALSAGAGPVALAQIESRFADEEFFVALEAASLSLFWLLLLGGYRFAANRVNVQIGGGARLDRRGVALLFFLGAFGSAAFTVRAYRHSFYSNTAPAYPGISSDQPFICGTSSALSGAYRGEEVFARIVGRVAANPRKGAPEYGMLALATGERIWAEQFRIAVLQEAAEGRYTGPAQSVKAGQFAAALRAYYFPRIRARFPTLFSEQDLAQIRQWFAAINKRALTVEWVDALYAVAFSKWPEGPYENQESGAGLLALLEREGLADASLSPANRTYLSRNPRGWLERFRVTDDAVIYQPEWIYNAYFQHLYTGNLVEANTRRSFEWLLLQALPDGAPLRYNHPRQRSWAGVAYLGAQLLQDPRLLWLAGRAAEHLEEHDGYLFAQVGVERPIALVGRAPEVGSCLLYGDSGLPNQKGPLAPDKLVLRDGWSDDSLYLLANLRFTGWHRYKSTGTISLIYRKAPLVAEVLEGEPFRWLPTGRSLFRDKRIPRENLNGLVVEKTGMAAVIHQLTGLGSPWAQDPPPYAEVIAFETSKAWDRAHIRLTDWRGWQHDRWITLQHTVEPRIIITDTAHGPSGSQAGLIWHLTDAREVAGGFELGSTDATMHMRLIPLDGHSTLEIRPLLTQPSGRSVIYRGESSLSLVTSIQSSSPSP